MSGKLLTHEEKIAFRAYIYEIMQFLRLIDFKQHVNGQIIVAHVIADFICRMTKDFDDWVDKGKSDGNGGEIGVLAMKNLRIISYKIEEGLPKELQLNGVPNDR